MPLQPGLRLGPYEIVSLLGAGGMGEVYKARDTRLDRTVAIKVLPASLSEDRERRERFEREARAVSALNHPNICTLHDIGHQDGVDFLVMEFVDGESLEDRLTKGPLPLVEVLRLGTEIADAISKAHRQGIVHRDLKPANVMLTRTGAKLLDFGLARVEVPPGSSSSVSFLPTQHQRALTQAGTVLGTFQYMSPEQLEGRDADARTDIFAFGALLYEAVTGHKAFESKSQASLISAIMAGTPPPISSAQPMTPPALERVIQKCLAKDPDDRWQTAQDLSAELKWIAGAGSQVGMPAPVVARRKLRERGGWIAAGIFAILSTVLLARMLMTHETALEPIRFSFQPPKDVALEWPRISPDGRMIAFVGVDPLGKRSVWVRPIGSFDALHLEGTDGVARPFWSPDSRHLAFFAHNQLKKVAAAGGPTQLICDCPGGSDGSWGRGVILFDANSTDPIRRVPDGGGASTVAVKPDATRKEAGSGWPYFLPDGRHFLFIANDAKGPANVMVGAIDSDAVTILDAAQSRVEYAAGHLFYVNQQTLMARPFSPANLAFTGEAFPVTDRIAIQGGSLADFSTSQSGDLAYATEAIERRSRLTWFDRTGKELGVIGEPALYRSDIALAPDETRAAVAIGSIGPKSGTDDSIWTIDLKRGVASRLTFGSDLQSFPLWSPDSMRIAYSATGKGGLLTRVVQRLASGVGEEQPIADVKDGVILATDWSSDGKVVLLSWATGSDVGLLTVPADGHAAPSSLLKAPSPIREINGRLSPDNRWFAYQSNESGRTEVYVQSYPPSGGKWQISTAGGAVPMWRGDGRELFYVSLDDTLFAAAVDVVGAGIEVGLPVRLFQHRLAGRDGRNRNSWVSTRDGQRFLMNAAIEDGTTRGIQVVLNWTAGLKKSNQ
jgi:eukaryotic-like serine/threonine-protein kinase